MKISTIDKLRKRKINGGKQALRLSNFKQECNKQSKIDAQIIQQIMIFLNISAAQGPKYQKQILVKMFQHIFAEVLTSGGFFSKDSLHHQGPPLLPKPTTSILNRRGSKFEIGNSIGECYRIPTDAERQCLSSPDHQSLCQLIFLFCNHKLLIQQPLNLNKSLEQFLERTVNSLQKQLQSYRPIIQQCKFEFRLTQQSNQFEDYGTIVLTPITVQSRNQFSAAFSDSKLPLNFQLAFDKEEAILTDRQKYIIKLESRTQSTFKTLQSKKFKQPNLQNLALAVQLFGKNSVMTLRSVWDQYLNPFLQVLMSNFDLYRAQYENMLINLIRVFQFRSFQKEKLYDRVLKKISSILSGLRKKIGLKSIQQLYEIYTRSANNQNDREHLSNFIRFFQKGNGIQKLPKQIPVNYILQMTQIHPVQRKDLKIPVRNIKDHSKLEITINKAIQTIQNYKEGHKPQNQSGVLDFVSELDFETTYQAVQHNQQALHHNSTELVEHMRLDYSCLGCASYFYHQRNVLDPSVNRTPVIFLPTVKRLRGNLKDLITSIVALLNSGGGIILFDFEAYQRSFYPKGQYIKESQKYTVTKIIERSFERIKCLQQNQSTKENIRIDFVPILNPSNSNKQPENNPIYTHQAFIQGLYVLRLRVCPLDSSLIYYHSHGILDQLQVYSQLNNKTILLKPKEIVKIIKRKIRVHHVSDHLFEEFRIVSQKIQNCFSHDCSPPALGFPLAQEGPEQQIVLKSLQKEYRTMCLFVARESQLPELQKKFRKIGLKFTIKLMFEKYCFKSARYTGILFQDWDYFQLLQKISKNNDFCFDGKPFLVVRITHYLKFKNEGQIDTNIKAKADKWNEQLNKEFPRDGLKVYQSQEKIKRQGDKQIVYYLKMQSKTATLFMYYVLNNFQQKALFKDPERNQQLTLIYESKPQQQL